MKLSLFPLMSLFLLFSLGLSARPLTKAQNQQITQKFGPKAKMTADQKTLYKKLFCGQAVYAANEKSGATLFNTSECVENGVFEIRKLNGVKTAVVRTKAYNSSTEKFLYSRAALRKTSAQFGRVGVLN